MGFLSIRKVEYLGDHYYFESPIMDSNISIIEGPNGTGKSTFFNLIYYGLGGRVEEFDPTSREVHKEIAEDSNNLVRLVVTVDGVLFTLNRKIGDQHITVIKSPAVADGVTEQVDACTYPLVRRENVTTFSDWLLERLSIPVVDIFQGARQFKLNFTDLARLFYHNQSSDPNGVYKPADSVNFLSDSLEIRKAIFQILIGKTLLDLYEAIGRQKAAERDVQAARSTQEEYEDIVAQILNASGQNIIVNSKALSEQIEVLESQVKALLSARRAFSRGKIANAEAEQMLEVESKIIKAKEVEMRELEEQQVQLVRQAGQLIDVERDLLADIQRINKVIYAHGQLNLFSRDTCPYCLNDVARTPGHCMCGNAVNELDYQRFFYSPAEYLDLLRSKTKTLETLKIAKVGVKEDSTVAASSIHRLFAEISLGRKRFDEAFSAPDRVEQAMEELDEKLLDTREKIAKLEEAFRLEVKLNALTLRYNRKKELLDSAKADVNRLDGASKIELHNQIKEFNRVYNEFMTTVVSDCRSASIDAETYLPLLNNGEYREHSAKVPKRFLYYLTLLQLSLTSNVPFPRLLLVDTPETAGIDLDKLVKMLRQIEKLENPQKREFQILFSTGIGKYPPELDGNVVLRLRDDTKLLQKKQF
jgi:hypothetical protein